MATILTLTLNPAIDITAEIDRLVPQAKLRCGEPVREPGGGGVNVARMITRLGGKAHAFIAIGGASGDELKAMVEREGVRVIAFEAPGATRETLQVRDRASGELYRFLLPGPRWDEEATRRLEARVVHLVTRGGYRHVVASGSPGPGMPEDVFARIAGRLARHDVRFILDTSGPALARGIEAPLALVKPNRHEIAELGRLCGGEGDDPEAMARAVVAAGRVESVVFTRGAGGAVLVERSGVRRWRAPPAAVNSLTGAGDAFLAAVVLALENGKDRSEATRYGVAAAAAAIASATTGFTDREEVDRLLDAVEEA